MYTRSMSVPVDPVGLGEPLVLNNGVPSYTRLVRPARWHLLRNVTTSNGVRLIRGQLVYGRRWRAPSGELMISTDSFGWFPSRFARLRLEGLSGLFGLGQGHESAHTSNVGRDGRSTSSVIESIGTAIRNVAEGTAAVVREGERASVARAGGSSDDAPPPDMSMGYGTTTTGFLSTTGGKVLLFGGVGLAVLATVLFLTSRSKTTTKNRRRRRNRRAGGRIGGQGKRGRRWGAVVTFASLRKGQASQKILGPFSSREEAAAAIGQEGRRRKIDSRLSFPFWE